MICCILAVKEGLNNRPLQLFVSVMGYTNIPMFKNSEKCVLNNNNNIVPVVF
jgi:hypothetical protein